MPWKRPFRRHCSDELLLGHADGELSWAREVRVRKHLKRCWECRGRLAELEGEAATLAKAFADTSFLGPGGLARALRELSAGVEKVEKSFTAAPRLTMMPVASMRPRVLVAAAAAAVICLVALGVRPSRDPHPSELLAAAQEAERLWGGAPLVHASLRIEVAEIRPAERRRSGRIDIWSEPAHRRSAVRWNDQQGTLRYAVWRPAEGHKYIFNSSGGQILTEGTDSEGHGWLAWILEAQPTLEQVEAAFLRWLGSRQWHALDLAGNMAQFVDASGIQLQAEKIPRGSGTTAVRLVVDRPDARGRVEIVLEVDQRTHRPQFERVRLEAAGRVVEFSLAVDRMEAISPRELRPGIFEPDAPVWKNPAPPTISTATARIDSRKAAPDVELVDAAQVGADYLIHRAGACLRESVEVVREAPDAICVRGVMENNESKSRLLRAFAQLPSSALLRFDLQTLQDAPVQPPFSGHVLPRETYTATWELPLQDLLERAFGGQAEIITFTNDAVFASDNLMAHAWALNRLASGYGQVAPSLRAEPRWLLEAMAWDHLVGLQGGFVELRRRCDPLLKLVSENQADPAAKRVAADMTWTGSLQAVFATSRQVDRLVQALAAGAGLEDKPEGVVAGELRTELLRLDEDLRRAEAVVKQGFRSGDSVARSQ